MFKKLPIPHIRSKKGKLIIGRFFYSEITDITGTPVLVMIGSRIRYNINRLKNMVNGAKIFYSCKANSIPHVLKVISDEKIGIEVVSLFELELALKYFNGDRIILTSPIKQKELLEKAIKSKIKTVASTFSDLELLLTYEETGLLSAQTDILLRIATSKTSHLGFNLNDDMIQNKLMKYLQMSDSINIIGIHLHSATQIHSLIDEFKMRLNKAINAIDFLSAAGVNIKFVDLGGGLPESMEVPDELLSTLNDLFIKFKDNYPNIELAIEPGRFIVGDAGILLASVLGIEDVNEKIVFLDAGINVLPKFSGGKTHFAIANKLNVRYDSKMTIRGNLPTEIDILKKNYFLPSTTQKGDIMVAFNAGAYTFPLWQRFCTLLPPIVWVYDDKWEIIKEKESTESYLNLFIRDNHERS